MIKSRVAIICLLFGLLGFVLAVMAIHTQTTGSSMLEQITQIIKFVFYSGVEVQPKIETGFVPDNRWNIEYFTVYKWVGFTLGLVSLSLAYWLTKFQLNSFAYAVGGLSGWLAVFMASKIIAVIIATIFFFKLVKAAE